MGIGPNICSIDSGKYVTESGSMADESAASLRTSACDSVRFRFLYRLESPVCSDSESGSDAPRLFLAIGRCKDQTNLRLFHAARIRAASISTPIILAGLSLCANYNVNR